MICSVAFARVPQIWEGLERNWLFLFPLCVRTRLLVNGKHTRALEMGGERSELLTALFPGGSLLCSPFLANIPSLGTL